MPVLPETTLPPLIPQSAIVDIRTGAPTQFFLDYINSQSSKIVDAVSALNAAVNAVSAAQAQSVAQQQQVVTAQQSAAEAQAQADTATGSGAQSGNALLTVAIAPGGGWSAGPQVNLAGVAAGNLSIINSGPNQQSDTEVFTQGYFTGSWRIVEIVGASETTVFTGTYSAERVRDDLGFVNFLYNTSDTAAVSIASASTGAVSYRLDINSPLVEIHQVQLYLYVRRS